VPGNFRWHGYYNNFEAANGACFRASTVRLSCRIKMIYCTPLMSDMTKSTFAPRFVPSVAAPMAGLEGNRL
jgi:hypothetical protein